VIHIIRWEWRPKTRVWVLQITWGDYVTWIEDET